MTTSGGWLCEKCGMRVYVSRADHAMNHRARPVESIRRSKRRRRLAIDEPASKAIEINAEFRAALDAIDRRKPIVLVHGGAGTGKSTFIRALREHAAGRNMAVLAPTGVAALTAGGQTIHSFCRLPLKVITVPDDVDLLHDPSVVERLDLLVVDEVSMVRADVLDGLECSLRKNRKKSEPFGGVQIVLIGDPLQLPPVARRDDEQLLTQRYGSEHFFRASCLRGLRSTPVELQQVYRQKDAAFAALLAEIRDGRDVARSVRTLNEACVGRALDGPHLVLVPTRAAAAAENERRLMELHGKARVFAGSVEGSFTKKSEDALPAPVTLTLKKGAQVMFTRNDPEGRWVNGTVGIVTRAGKKSVHVELGSGDEYEVEPVTWEDRVYAHDEEQDKVVQEVVGTYRQFPLMTAWAVTIHKAQGLTLGQVAVDLDRGAFAPAQVYVALSRCSTLEGLSLRRPIRAHEIQCDPAAREFVQRLRRIDR